MRTIKFRVWNIKNKKCIYENDARYNRLAISFDGNVYHGGYDDVLSTSDYIIQQYTGLKDRNGKEIYEGDILKYEPLGATIYYEVFWDEANGAWKNTKENGGNIGSWFDLYEVAGNIFENPELLKQ